MLPTQTIEELISISYVSAIIAHAGFIPSIPSKDYGVDIEVRQVVDYKLKKIDFGAILEFQLKASINWEVRGNHVVYDLEIDAYNKLVHRREHGFIPCLLVLYCLPKEKNDWLQVSETELIIRKCCYYYFISDNESNNAYSQRIKIPCTQLLTPISILELSEKSRRGELL